ncbi:MAG: glycosyl hydrolase 115 family protein, partial [Bacteroidota bacterium]|nr:glycosyl hydrolase 115 family protein [Bacteroidota bacterium]
IDYFADLAWNLKAMGPDSQPRFLHSFAAEHFGDKLAQQISGLLGEFYRLGTIHKPELMNRAWALSLPAESAAELNNDYTNLLKKEEKITNQIPAASRDAYFELVGFPARVLGASGLIFMADRKIQLGGDSVSLKKEITRLRGFLEKQVERYNNETAGGKWKFMMPGLETAKNLTAWNSQVRWPWGEKTNLAPDSKNSEQEVRVWRDAATADHQSTSGVAKWATVPGLGSSGRALALLPTSPEFSWKVNDNSAPMLEFEFTPKSSQGDVLINFMPTFRISPGMQLRVVVGVDNQQPVEVEVPGSNGKEDENGPNRRNGIQNNFVQAKVSLTGLSAGKHVLKIRAVDPGVVIDKVSLPIN